MYRKVFIISIILSMIYMVIPGWAWGQNHPRNSVDKMVSPEDIPVVHPQFRKWPEPSSGMEASYNPPFFLWPVTHQNNSTYDVRLATDPDFKEIVFMDTDIPYAISNPYQRLNPGKWYWQYRTNDGPWSKVSQFTISDSTPIWNLPSKVNFRNSISKGHPRVLISKEEWSRLRQETSEMEDTRRIIQNAEVQMQRPFIQEELDIADHLQLSPSRINKLKKDASKVLGNTAFEVIGGLSKAYVLTKNQKYADKAKEWAMTVASWDPEGVSSMNDFGDSRCMLSMALAYDTFYDQLSTSEKEQLLQAIRYRGDRFYHHWINLIEAKVLSNHVWQHILHYFFQTALATYGDIPEAEDWVDYLYELFLARAPALGRDDGAWVNGNSYFTMNMDMLLDIPLTIKELTGFDFIRHNNWYQNNPWYLWYSLPPHSSSDGFGDNSKGFSQPNNSYIAYADALGKITQNPIASKYAIESTKGTGFHIADDDNLRWLRLKYLRNMTQPDKNRMKVLEKAHVFKDAGLVYMHSHPSNTSLNLMLALRSSPFGSYGHMLADQNTFNILYGGKPLYYHSGHKISMNDPHRLGWYKHTKSHNGILINGHGQPYSSEAYGCIPRFINGKYLAYAKGDASMAYNTVEHGGKVDYGVRRFDRHVVMLYPDIIVTYDVLEADHPAEWSWVLHSPYKINLKNDQNTFSCEMDEASSRVSVFGSEKITWQLTDEYEVPAENWRKASKSGDQMEEYNDSGWHLKGTTDRTGDMRFLSVIQVGPDGQLVHLEHDQKGTIKCGEWIFNAELNDDVSPKLKITRKDGKMVFITGGDEIHLDGKTYKGRKAGSAKLAEMSDGQVVFQESDDQMPTAMQLAAKQFEQK